jgi:AAT family amino acid transporter
VTRKSEGLSVWQLTMFALGTVVGGSFFLGSSLAIRSSGPSVLFAYMIGGVLVYLILSALSEMTVAHPAPGSFRTYAEQAYGRGTGFTVGWVYWTGLALAMSSEATAVSILLRGWFPGLPLALLGAAIIAGVTLLNLLGADRLSKLESGLAAVKLLAIVAFIIIAAGLIAGWGAGGSSGAIGLGALRNEPWLTGGLRGIAGSMLIVMFTYAGFEVIGLAASETREPKKTIPRAIGFTIILLVGLYLAAIAALLPLISTSALSGEVSPFVSALGLQGLGWAGTVMNVVLISAILSTMLAATFGLGRMLRSLSNEGHTPAWMRDRTNVPYRGILISGAAMLVGLGLGLLLPQNVYLFLISSGGFSLLFTYIVILASHYRLRKRNGRPLSGASGPAGLPWFPYSSWISIGGLTAILASMPLIPGQGSGLIAGAALVALFSGLYIVSKRRRFPPREASSRLLPAKLTAVQSEMSEELQGDREQPLE